MKLNLHMLADEGRRRQANWSISVAARGDVVIRWNSRVTRKAEVVDAEEYVDRNNTSSNSTKGRRF